eukprot:gnl/MRDRNA2_/MRDRNA2_66631_c0_seq3.p1 gnl/MRDRNA2_/MRDRNA2_66631_c0~~gnl/MRDRNA2_/MRDRNA2_66631_c0_seq3.p1  ORF type:complete len:251 (-),score=24.16 gnl/MRDRNA2_/MRDRNA2_66631_c0_seq3:522-1274(-)
MCNTRNFRKCLMTERKSCFWLVCCSLLQLASSHLPDFQGKLVKRSHSAGSPYGGLESVTVQKPGKLGSSSGTTFNRGVAHIPKYRSNFCYGMYQSNFCHGTSGNIPQLQSPMPASSQQRGKQVPNALLGFPDQVVEAVQQGVQEVQSEEDFDSIVSHAQEPVMVQFTVTACGPCKVFAPTFNRIASDYSGKARFLKVTVNENAGTLHLGRRYKLKAVPAFLLFHHEEIIAKESGISVENNLRQALSTSIG